MRVPSVAGTLAVLSLSFSFILPACRDEKSKSDQGASTDKPLEPQSAGAHPSNAKKSTDPAQTATYALEKTEETPDSLVIHLIDKDQARRAFLVVPRPRIDPQPVPPIYTYNPASDAGRLDFKIVWPDGLDGDRKAIKASYAGRGNVVDVYRHQLRDAKCTLVLADAKIPLTLGPREERERFQVDLTRDAPIKPDLLTKPGTSSKAELQFRYSVSFGNQSFPVVFSFKPFTKPPLAVEIMRLEPR